MRFLEVVRAGPLTTVQDAGRPGLAHLGIPRSGAVDLPALRQANQLVGNPSDHAGLEITLTGAVLRPTAPVTVAIAGAPATVTIDGGAAEWGAAVAVPAGATLKIGPARRGVRTYLAVAGGIEVDPVLGSRSTDVLAGLGPPVIRDGDRLPLGDPVGAPASHRLTPPEHSAVLRVRLGPRDDWFTPDAIATLFSAEYTVSPTSNRIGVRLTGPPLPRAIEGELPSEGLVTGAIQVPAGGQPLVFLADHPTTGGYPVIGVVAGDDLPIVAQARPGTKLRFQRYGD